MDKKKNKKKNHNLYFGLYMGENITCSDLHSRRIPIPKDDDKRGGFTKYSDIEP